MELIGRGVIDFWSLDSTDSGRSRKYDVVVVDEAAMIPALEEAWQQTIRPTLTDLQGSAWFLSTAIYSRASTLKLPSFYQIDYA